MKITSVVHEISMKISSVHRPKSDLGRTVVIGLSQRLQPHDDTVRAIPASSRTARSVEALNRRLVMVWLTSSSFAVVYRGPVARASRAGSTWVIADATAGRSMSNTATQLRAARNSTITMGIDVHTRSVRPGGRAPRPARRYR